MVAVRKQHRAFMILYGFLFEQPRISPASSMAQSNFDRRRINGPEESFPPIYEDDDVEPSSLSWRPGKPRQGRTPSDIRPICTVLYAMSCAFSPLTLYPVLKAGLISQANGSAYIETQRTKIACAVSVTSIFMPLSSLNSWLRTVMALASLKAQYTARRDV